MEDLEAMKGTWRAIYAERDGEMLSREQIDGVTLIFEASGRAVTMKRDQLLFEGVFNIDPTKKPKREDATQTSEGDNKGKTILSIYEIKGDTLRICSAGSPEKERPAEFSSIPGSGHFLRVFERERKQAISMATRDQARHFYSTLDSQNWTALAALVSPDVMVQLGSASPINFASWQDSLKAFYVGFPEGHHVIDDYLVADDRVVTRCRFEGVHAGVFGGLQPSGKSASVGVIHIDRFKNGLLIEHFGQLDTLGLMKQIGAEEGQ